MANAAAVAAALAGDSERNETLFFSRLAPVLPLIATAFTHYFLRLLLAPPRFFFEDLEPVFT